MTYYIGYFSNGQLIAVMDLIDGYPQRDIAFIGFFMTDAEVHNRGVGSAIIADAKGERLEQQHEEKSLGKHQLVRL